MSIGYVEIIPSLVNDPVITIAIPTYKREGLLIDAVKSAIDQDFRGEYEIIVVDNNPERNDETEIAMKQYCNIPNLAYYKNYENLGMMGNWNRLYELSKGKYVAMLHDDDILYDNYLAIIDNLIKNPEESFSFIYPSFFFSKDRQIPNKEQNDRIVYYSYKPQDFVAVPNGIPSGMVLEKVKFRNVGEFTMEYYPISDQDFNFRALNILKGCRISSPQIVLYYMGGQNESCRSETTCKFVHSTYAFYKSICNKLVFPWSVLSLLTRRDVMNGMIKWWSNFGTEEDLQIAQKEIGWKKNVLKDLISKCIRYLIWLYINVVRKRTIILSTYNKHN